MGITAPNELTGTLSGGTDETTRGGLMSNTPTDDAQEQEGTSVTRGPETPTESEPGAVEGNPESPGEQAGAGQAGG